MEVRTVMKTQHWIAVAVMMSVMCWAVSAQASWVYTEDFNSTADGQLPAGWNDLGSTVGWNAVLVQGGQLTEVPANSGSKGMSVYQPAGSANWSDYTVRATVGQNGWNSTTSTWTALVAYVQSEDEWYGMRFRRSSDSTFPVTVQLIKGLAGGAIGSFETSSKTSLSPTGGWTFQLELTNEPTRTKVVGKAWYPGQDPDTNSPFRTLTGYDTDAGRYLSGGFGGADSTGGYEPFWDDFKATVPEPATLTLLGIGVVSLIRRRR